MTPNTILVPRMPAACFYMENMIRNLQLLDPNGGMRLFEGGVMSGGHFTHIIASSPGIVLILAPTSYPARDLQSIYGAFAHWKAKEERALYVVPIDYGPTDWILAIEEQAGCDPAWVYHLLHGKLPECTETVTELYDSIKRNVLYTNKSKESVSYSTYQLWPNKTARKNRSTRGRLLISPRSAKLKTPSDS